MSRFLPVAVVCMFPTLAVAQANDLRPVRIANPVNGHIHPAACVTQVGTIVVTYGHINHRDLRITRSSDGGKTWSAPAPFVHTVKKTYYPGSLTTLSDGRLLHAWNRWSGETTESEPRSVLYSLSDDDGVTWSEPKPLPRDEKVMSVIRHPIVELGRDRWLVSLSDRTFVFDPARSTGTPLGDARTHGLVPIVRTPRGTLVSGAGSRSTDDGETWTEITKFPNLKEQGWRHELVSLSNGWLLASEILGPGVGGERIRYVISRDDGLTWNDVFEYYNPGRPIGGRACPRTVELDAETIGVVFYDVSEQQDGGPGLFFLRIPLARLTQTAPLAGPAAQSGSAEWPQFLGPQRNGISTETGLMQTWPTDGPKEVWRAAGGVGMSGLAVSRGRLLTLVQRDAQQWLIALDAMTGKTLWQTAIAPEYRNQMGDGPRGTPTISGDRVYAFTGDGRLVAVGFNDGKLAWSHDTVKELGGKTAEYGMACSPLIVGDHVIVTVGAPQATVAAYETQSGKLAWTAGDDVAGYSSPALLDVGGRPQIVVYTGSSVLGLAPKSGAVLWRYPYETNFECNIATPLAYKGQVFISSGENHGAALLALKPRGDEFDVREVWTSQGPQSVLRNEWQTSMLLDGHLYGMDNVGGAGPVTHLTCVNAATGERVWQKARFGKGNLIAADGKLFISTMNGELVVVRATSKGYDEIGHAVVIGSTRQAPALAGGLLYLRDDQHVVCLDVRQR